MTKKKSPKENIKSRTRWAGVEKALKEGTYSGYMMGVVETEKIFTRILDEKRIPGKDTDAKIKYIKKFLSLPQKLDNARQIYYRIVENLNSNVTQQETKEAIAGYWQAAKDIEEAFAQLSFQQKAHLRAKYWRQKWFKISKKSAIDIALFLALIIFLYDTKIGQSLAIRVAQGAHFFVFKILPWIVSIIASLYLLGYIWKILDKKRDKV